MTDDPKLLAARMLERDRARIASAIGRQLCTLAPRFRTLPFDEVERTVDAVLVALHRTLDGDGHKGLLLVADRAFEERAAQGFQAIDLVLTTHAYLPVLRRFFCERVEDVSVGLLAYEEVEAVALGFMRPLVTLAIEARATTDPGFKTRPAPQITWPPAPVIVERVED